MLLIALYIVIVNCVYNLLSHRLPSSFRASFKFSHANLVILIGVVTLADKISGKKPQVSVDEHGKFE